ncbi:hypothetical protein [Agromyces marinus]|uniref:DUF222 domain-containing protein n=1 Tax=Agromyces marinus TaxID=1389020 RepID=A0ABN6YCU6_9MICO|nr:hypothetical protein [Agromyces marinus]BDZ55195.1 hypothetical protein GCM10025870_22680 [Agromyces marinus]
MKDVARLLQDLHETRNAIDVGERTLSYERKGDVRAHSKRMDAHQAALNKLAVRPEGRLALETLLRDSPITSLRISIANVVMRWDSFSARDVLEEIVTSAGGRVTRPMTMTAALHAPDGTATNAALSLLNLARTQQGM